MEDKLKLRCYKFSLDIIKFSDTLSSKYSSRIIQDQVVRSATSVGANLVEAKSSSSRLEFKRFFEIALKSANETKYWLGLIRDANLGNRLVSEKLLVEITEIANMIGKSVLTLKKKKF